MSWKQWLFSFQGRIGRQRFWIWNIFYYAVILGMGAFLAQSGLGNMGGYILSAVVVCLLIPDLAVTAKRWHDRNKSNWWLLLYVPIILGRLGGADIAADTMTVDSMTPMMAAQAIVTLVSIFCGMWTLVECGFMKGTDGENSYGKSAQ
ncbi:MULTISPECIES: DUF805 domain-containing protein [Vibrio]|uniref:DUF805 domain-containing protein n=1 Tax=Vibrio algicola TaxID=2662262 RepID=A0A5Q0TGT7_9VIBR|nr:MULTISPECIES: DUF805 domain-containing protein [Vibrio]MBD1575744.1 DUF805 domain-containing protein [Vibrio sp. S11_S32]